MFDWLFNRKIDPDKNRKKEIVVAIDNISDYINILKSLINDFHKMKIERIPFKSIYKYEFLVTSDGYALSEPVDKIIEMKSLAKELDIIIRKITSREQKEVYLLTYKRLLVDNAILISKELSN